MHQFYFGPRWGSLQRSPRLPSWFKGPRPGRKWGRDSRGGEGREEVGEGQRTGEGKRTGRDARERVGKARGRRKERRGGKKSKNTPPPPSIPAYAPAQNRFQEHNHHVSTYVNSAYDRLKFLRSSLVAGINWIINAKSTDIRQRSFAFYGPIVCH